MKKSTTTKFPRPCEAPTNLAALLKKSGAGGFAKAAILPLHDRVLVRTPRTSAEEKGERVSGLIIIPEVASQATKNAIDPIHIVCVVLACGPDAKSVKPGQRVVVRKPDLFVMSPDIVGDEQTLIFDKHIMAVLK